MTRTSWKATSIVLPIAAAFVVAGVAFAQQPGATGNPPTGQSANGASGSTQAPQPNGNGPNHNGPNNHGPIGNGQNNANGGSGGAQSGYDNSGQAGSDSSAKPVAGQGVPHHPNGTSPAEGNSPAASGNGSANNGTNGGSGSGNIQAMSHDDTQWAMPGKNWQNTRYSNLDQINNGNVDRLGLAWSFSMGSDRGQEEVPLVVGDTMYIEGAYPNHLYALDSSTGELKWTYVPRVDPSAVGEACCDTVTRGISYDNGKIFMNTLDDHVVAVDARTGEQVWVTKVGDINKGMTLTMAPIVVHGKVLLGNSGGEMGVRGWVTALDENTGKIVWRAYSTGPDKDVLIGKNFHPYYPSEKGKDLGEKSWPPGAWKIGGGPVWGWISYDPELNLIYYGTGNPGPWNSNQRPGDNKWTTTIFARNPDTGEAVWADQLNPHDLWDYDEINENVLLDLTIDGKKRKVLIHPGRNGYMYVIDRATGQILSADPYDTVTSTLGIDLKTGRPIERASLKPVLGQTSQGVCPASPGAKDWQPTAYSPKTGLLYVPHQHLCMNYKTAHVGYIAGTPYIGAIVDMYAGPGGYRGEFMAWDPIKRKKVWAIHEKLPVWTGTLVTGGNVAFYGTLDRWFKAVDATNGKPLYQFAAPSGFIGQPMTYMGKDGVQYVAIVSGAGGWPAALAHADIDPRVRNGALGFTGATQDVPQYTEGGSDLLVFSLGGRSAGKPQIQPIDNPPIGATNPAANPGRAQPPMQTPPSNGKSTKPPGLPG